MTDVTDADREKAASIVGSMSPWRDLLAAALAAERAKARAPFVSICEEYDAGRLWSSQAVDRVRTAIEETND